MCSCEFQPALGISQPKVSLHLEQQPQAGMLTRDERGAFAYLGLAPRALQRIGALLAEQPAPTSVA